MKTEQKTTFYIYIIFLVATISSFLPIISISFLGSILFSISIIIIYVFRFKSKEGSFRHGHMDYLIKSFWITSLLLSVGMSLSFLLGNHSIINDTIDDLMNGFVVTEEEMGELLIEYLYANIFILILTISPSIIYLTYRIIKGFICAKKLQAIINPKTWL